MAGTRGGSGVLLVLLLVVLGMVVVEPTSATATPNSYWSCIKDCPGYNCRNRSLQECAIYCGTACGIPPKFGAAATVDATHYCMVGCATSSVTALSTNSATEAMKDFINGCSNICNAAAVVPSK